MSIVFYRRLSSVFYRFLFSFLVVLVPLLAYAVLISYDFAKTTEKNIFNSIINTNTNMIKDFERETREIEEISLRIQNSQTLRPYYNDNEQFSEMIKISMINELGNYNSANEFISEILFYLRGNRTLYASSSTYQTSMFVPDIYYFTKWSKSDFLYDINNVKQPYWRGSEPVTDKGTYLTCLYPIPLQSLKPYATIVFLIDEKNFYDRIAKYVDSDRIVLILDKNNKIIFSNSKNTEFNMETVLDSSQKPEPQLLRLKDKLGREYYYSCLLSQKNGFKFMTFVPYGVVMQKIYDHNSRYYLLMLIIFVITGVTAFLFSYINYNPIRNLRDYAMKTFTPDQSISNELDIVSSIIDKMNSNTLQLSNRIYKARAAVAEYVVYRLIQGGYETVEELNNDGKECGIVFSKNAFFTAVFCLSSIKRQMSNLEIIEFLNREKGKWLPDGYEAYAKDSMEEKNIIIVFCCEPQNNKEIEADLNYIRNVVSRLFSSSLTIGVGKMYHNISEIGKSFSEACDCVRFRLIFGKDSIIMSSSMDILSAEAVQYPREEIDSLQEGLLLGDSDKISSVLAEIMKILRNVCMPVELVRSICYDIVNTIIKVNYNFAADDKTSSITSLDVNALVAFQSVDDIERMVLSASNEIRRVIGSNQNDSPAAIQNIIAYMKENFCKYDFSVQSMSEHFGISASNMTHFFKKHTGQTVMEYLNILRINKAKEILANTDIPLKEIVHSVGYCDTSTFIRKFKTHVGITPGQYKERSK